MIFKRGSGSVVTEGGETNLAGGEEEKEEDEEEEEEKEERLKQDLP